MKRMLALLLAAMLILTLLPGCGKKDPGGDAPEVPENPSEQGGETPDVTPEPEPYVDPYEAVRTYWSEDQLTQSWGPDQVVEHLFFHPVIAYPQWAFHDCGACRQFLYEFSPDMKVICLNRAREAKRMTLRELMPCGFDSTFL